MIYLSVLCTYKGIYGIIMYDYCMTIVCRVGYILLFLAFSDVDPAVLCFRVKFYPSETMKIHEELTR